MLSSSILKYGTTVTRTDSKRVIDTNEMVEKRIADLAKALNLEDSGFQDGFVAGLAAEEVEVLLSDENINEEEEMLSEGRQVVEEGPTYEELIQQARDEIATMWQEERQKLSEEREQTLQEAREQGYAQGMQEAEGEYSAKQAALEEEQRRLQAEYDQALQNIEPQMVDVLTQIYEQVIGIELKHNRNVILYLLENALRNTEGGKEILVHVSREDFPMVSMQKNDILVGVSGSSTQVDVVEDATLDRNQCMIETEGGIFDCSLGTQLEELTDRIRLLSFEQR